MSGLIFGGPVHHAIGNGRKSKAAAAPRRTRVRSELGESLDDCAVMHYNGRPHRPHDGSGVKYEMFPPSPSRIISCRCSQTDSIVGAKSTPPRGNSKA